MSEKKKLEYNTDTDWQAEINRANESGDYASAATYEKYRNQKIDDLGLGYAKTNVYSSAPADSGLSTPKKAKSIGKITPSYTSQYSDEIKSLADKILNREQFSYNPEEDELYKQYEKQYTKAGKRAMEDTLGDVSANTGGLASSYATTAAQQSYNNYMGALADKVPELRQLAYDMYQDDYQRDLSNMGILQGLESTDYGRYRDDKSDYYTDRNYNYQLERDKVNDERYDKEWQLRQEQWAEEKVRDWRDFWQRDYEFNASRNDSNNQFQANADYQKDISRKSMLLDLWETTGYANDEIAAEFGVPKGATTASQAYALWQMEIGNREMALAESKQYSSAGGGSGNGGGKLTDNKPKEEEPTVKKEDEKEPAWIRIDGIGRVSVAELEELIKKDKVIVMENANGTFTYRKAE